LTGAKVAFYLLESVPYHALTAGGPHPARAHNSHRIPDRLAFAIKGSGAATPGSFLRKRKHSSPVESEAPF